MMQQLQLEQEREEETSAAGCHSSCESAPSRQRRANSKQSQLDAAERRVIVNGNVTNRKRSKSSRLGSTSSVGC
jgi:hypothetical protein